MKKRKINKAIEELLDMFKSGDMSGKIAKTVLKKQAGTSPSDGWSLGNQLLRDLAGTEDARGFKQWQKVGRRVKKGAKAFYILAPRIVTSKKEIEVENEEGEKEIKIDKRQFILGFRGIPVFRYEDTEGKPLPKVDYKPAVLPPLIDVAKQWEINVEYGAFFGRFYGYYQPGKDKIFLATHDVSTFFHELGHAAHKRVKGHLKGGQDSEQEVVAEMTSAVLCQLYGFKNKERHSYEYIKRYSKGADVIKSVMKVLSEIEKCLDLILTTASDLEEKRATA